MLRIIIVVFTIAFFGHNISAQTYDYTWKEHKKHFIGSSVFFTAAQLYALSTDLEKVDDLSDYDTRKLWRIDIGSVNRHWPDADKWSDVTLYSSLALPILLNIGNKENNGNGLAIAAIGLQGLLFENGLNVLVKSLAERPRPFIYNNKFVVLNSTLNKNASRSFYSGHTSGSAYLCFFGARIYADTHPNSKWKPLVWGVAATLPALTGLLRVKAKNHFATDVIVGYVMGAAIGNFIPQIYRNKNVNLAVAQGGLLFRAKF